MTVFSKPYAGPPDPEKKSFEKSVRMETSVSQTSMTEPTSNSKPWYKKLSFSAISMGRSNRSSIISDNSVNQARAMEEYLNKPLPPLPSPPPHFEYLFWDAGVDDEDDQAETDDDEDDEIEDLEATEAQESPALGSNSSTESYNLSNSEITRFAFAHAGVNVTTKEVLDNHFAALGTGIEGYLDHDAMAEEIEQAKASEAFFNTEVELPPTRDHIPMADGEGGWVNRREGLEEWPQLWQPLKETSLKVSEEDATQDAKGKAPEYVMMDGEKIILEPKSRKNKVLRPDPVMPAEWNYPGPSTMVTAPAVQPVQSPVRAPQPLTIRKRSNREPGSHFEESHRVKKRAARDSFTTRSTAISPKPDDFRISLLTTKKIRVTETPIDEDASSPARAVSMCGSIDTSSTVDLSVTTAATTPASSSSSPPSSANDDDDDEHDKDTELTDAPAARSPSRYDCDSSSMLSLKRELLTGTLSGFPGQFECSEQGFLETRASDGLPLARIRNGDATHPNNVYTHSNFIADPTYPAMDYTQLHLLCLPAREAALKDADRRVDDFSSAAARSETGDMLRRELYRECALARLEGVAVGQYRYYQGFLSLEEYHDMRLCVCWAGCWCSKLCGIYADVMCPCSKWIKVYVD